MKFNKYSNLAGRHALLSPSNYHWVNYDEEKLDRIYFTNAAAVRGTELHAFAHNAIRLGVRLPDNNQTLSMYVNDAIGFRMTPETTLFYSENCFGTADAIAFRRETLRIHDLKTGNITASVKQLEVYMAIFCLEYKMRPFDFAAELRIYQSNEVRVYTPDPDTIFHVMDKIVTFDRRIRELSLEA